MKYLGMGMTKALPVSNNHHPVTPLSSIENTQCPTRPFITLRRTTDEAQTRVQCNGPVLVAIPHASKV